jgi:6-phosphogluconolactonase
MPKKVLIGSFVGYLTLFDSDPATRQLSYRDSIAADSPSWLTLSQRGDLLYTTNEVEAGAVSSYRIDRSTGSLERLSCVLSAQGQHPTHIFEHPTRKTIYVSCYTSGSLSVHDVDADGVIQPSSQSIVHIPAATGRKSHLHQTFIGSTGEIASVVDLGNDHIMQYHLDHETGHLIQPTAVMSSIDFPRGSGPRHIAVHPHHDLAIVVCELSSSIMALHYDHKTKIVKHFDNAPKEWSTLRADENRDDMAAGEIAISANGLFIYVSNRDNSSDPMHLQRSSIAVFRIEDAAAGELRLLQIVSSGGRHPRHFVLLEDDSELLIANKDSANVVSYRVDPLTGLIDEASAVTSSSPHLQEPTYLLVL